MIARFWRGWTTPANADAYEALLRPTIFPGIRQRQIVGLQGIELLRRSAGTEVEFVTIMWFDSLQAVEAFAGGAPGLQSYSLRRSSTRSSATRGEAAG